MKHRRPPVFYRCTTVATGSAGTGRVRTAGYFLPVFDAVASCGMIGSGDSQWAAYIEVPHCTGHISGSESGS